MKYSISVPSGRVIEARLTGASATSSTSRSLRFVSAIGSAPARAAMNSSPGLSEQDAVNANARRPTRAEAVDLRVAADDLARRRLADPRAMDKDPSVIGDQHRELVAAGPAHGRRAAGGDQHGRSVCGATRRAAAPLASASTTYA